MASLNGLFSNVPGWDNLSYKVTGAVLRAVRAAVLAGVAVIATSVAQGELFDPAASPFVFVVLTAGLQAIDKFIREWRIEGDSGAASTDAAGGPDLNPDPPPTPPVG